MAETTGRNAVVTGAAGGMGRAITAALLKSERRVVLVDRDPARKSLLNQCQQRLAAARPARVIAKDATKAIDHG